MKTSTVKQIKDELKNRDKDQLLELCLSLSKYKKENKELLTYLLFESDYEPGYIESVKEFTDEQFEEINKKSNYWINKNVRKILRLIKKYIRYSKKKETEIELLIYFCYKLRTMKPSMFRNPVLIGIYERQIVLIEKAIAKLHEDLQYDYKSMLEGLDSYN